MLEAETVLNRKIFARFPLYFPQNLPGHAQPSSQSSSILVRSFIPERRGELIKKISLMTMEFDPVDPCCGQNLGGASKALDQSLHFLGFQLAAGLFGVPVVGDRRSRYRHMSLKPGGECHPAKP